MANTPEDKYVWIEHFYNWSYNEYNPVTTGYQVCKPNHSFGPGVVEVSIIHYVLSGTGIFVVNGKEYQLTKDQIFFFGPLEPVYFKADAKDPWVYVWVTFVATEWTPYRFHKHVMDAPELRPIFESLRDYPDHENTGRDFTARCLDEIARHLAKRTVNSAYLVERAAEFIRRKYSSDLLTVDSLAHAIGVSRHTLSNAFMKEMNVSPGEYLIRYRLQKACEYMSQQKLPPLIASNSVGYKNYRPFSKAFKKQYGISPREYYQQHTGKTQEK